MTTHAPNTTQLKSPIHGGLRGPTHCQPHTHASTTPLKSPQDWGDLGGPPRTHATRTTPPGEGRKK